MVFLDWKPRTTTTKTNEEESSFSIGYNVCVWLYNALNGILLWHRIDTCTLTFIQLHIAHTDRNDKSKKHASSRTHTAIRTCTKHCNYKKLIVVDNKRRENDINTHRQRRRSRAFFSQLVVFKCGKWDRKRNSEIMFYHCRIYIWRMYARSVFFLLHILLLLFFPSLFRCGVRDAFWWAVKKSRIWVFPATQIRVCVNAHFSIKYLYIAIVCSSELFYRRARKGEKATKKVQI